MLNVSVTGEEKYLLADMKTMTGHCSTDEQMFMDYIVAKNPCRLS